MILRFGRVLMSRFDLGLRTGVVVAADQLGCFFVRFGRMLHVLGCLRVVLLRGGRCRGVVCLCFVECHESFFQKLEKA